MQPVSPEGEKVQRMEKKLIYDTPAQKRRDRVIVKCKHNEGIFCNRRDIMDEWFCEHCGWNPVEQAKRKEEDIKLRILAVDYETESD